MRIYAMSSLFALAVAGCSIGGSASPAPAVQGTPAPLDGTLVVDWTINGGKDPNQCVQGQASSIELLVFSAGDPQGSSFSQACDVYATSVALVAGDYSANATLLDANGNPRTTSVRMAPFSILGNDELVIPVDFPADSFLQ